MSSILFETKGNAAYIILNRPDKFNAFNREMALELQRVLDECGKNSTIKAVALSGSGKTFVPARILANW